MPSVVAIEDLNDAIRELHTLAGNIDRELEGTGANTLGQDGRERLQAASSTARAIAAWLVQTAADEVPQEQRRSALASARAFLFSTALLIAALTATVADASEAWNQLCDWAEGVFDLGDASTDENNGDALVHQPDDVLPASIPDGWWSDEHWFKTPSEWSLAADPDHELVGDLVAAGDHLVLVGRRPAPKEVTGLGADSPAAVMTGQRVGHATVGDWTEGYGVWFVALPVGMWTAEKLVDGSVGVWRNDHPHPSLLAQLRSKPAN